VIEFASVKVAKLFVADRARTSDDEIGTIDFDPVISGQDGEATNVRLGPLKGSSDRVELDVFFLNFSPVTLHYTLVRENAGWKVDDIENRNGEVKWGLRALLGGH